MKNIKSFVELEFDELFTDTTIECDGEDIFCQDGVCPICNWKEYTEWEDLHKICDRFPYECPTPEDCFYNK